METLFGEHLSQGHINVGKCTRTYYDVAEEPFFRQSAADQTLGLRFLRAHAEEYIAQKHYTRAAKLEENIRKPNGKFSSSSGRAKCYSA